MKAQLLHGNGGSRSFALVFDKGDEAMSKLLEFAQAEGIDAASFTGIGAFSDVVRGFFDREEMDYLRIPLPEQLEVLSLVGDVALKEDGEPQVHAHVVVARADGTAHGGHLLEAHVWPTLEVVLTDAPTHLRRRMDAETGLPLITLEKTG
jgi:predicted DNA-binding protein with PD1-like motif